MIRDQSSALYLFVLLFMAIVVASSGCGPNKRTKTLHTTLVAINAARDGFLAWDRKHQEDLVKKATSRDEGQKSLDDYHAKRLPVVGSFELAYRAVALAATQNDGASLSAALAKAGELYDAVKALMGGG